MENDLDIELKGLRLDLIDLVSPFGISGKELSIFDNEVSSLVGLASEIQRESLKELTERIKVYYKKQKRVK